MKNSPNAGLLALIAAISGSACDPSKGKVNQTAIDSPKKNIDRPKAAINGSQKRQRKTIIRQLSVNQLITTEPIDEL